MMLRSLQVSPRGWLSMGREEVPGFREMKQLCPMTLHPRVVSPPPPWGPLCSGGRGATLSARGLWGHHFEKSWGAGNSAELGGLSLRRQDQAGGPFIWRRLCNQD